MTQEDKDLLLKDLSARLPYDVKVKYWPDSSFWGNHISPETCLLTMDILTSVFKREYSKNACLPYLRQMSSMTEEERKELLDLLFDKEAKGFYIDEEGLIDGKTSDLMKEGLNYPAFCPINVKIYTDYLNAHHFDWRIDSNGRTFIEKGLALEATEGMYNIKDK